MNVDVPAALDGARTDRALAELLDLSVNAVRRMLDNGRVTVGRRKPKKGDPIKAGDVVVVEGSGAWLVPDPSLAVPVVFVDDDVIIVDKPAGIACHPLYPGEGGTVVDALVARHPEIAHASDDEREAGLVHRLDTGTSGCLAIARNRGAWTALRAAFSTSHDVTKTYTAVVEGRLDRALDLTSSIAHDPADPRRMLVDDAGHAAHTIAKPISSSSSSSSSSSYTLVEATIDGPGRRHQIRVHLANAGFPLVGDVL